jgi:hypothetical protein
MLPPPSGASANLSGTVPAVHPGRGWQRDPAGGAEMNACDATRVLVPGVLVGAIVASMAGSDLAGWAAALLTMGVLIASRRMRGTGAACAVPPTDPPPSPATRSIEPSDDLPSPT